MIRSRDAIYRDHRVADPVVVRELFAIDARLFVTWSELHLDLTCGRPLLRMDGSPIRNPRWHVWTTDGAGVVHHLFDVAVLDHRVPRKIRADVARHLTEEQIHDRIDAAQASAKERKDARWKELRSDTVAANRRKFDEILEGDNLMRGPSRNTRDARILSYPGQAHRGSAFDTVPMTPAEEGWELPDTKREMEGY